MQTDVRQSKSAVRRQACSVPEDASGSTPSLVASARSVEERDGWSNADRQVLAGIDVRPSRRPPFPFAGLTVFSSSRHLGRTSCTQQASPTPSQPTDPTDRVPSGSSVYLKYDSAFSLNTCFLYYSIVQYARKTVFHSTID